MVIFVFCSQFLKFRICRATPLRLLNLCSSNCWNEKYIYCLILTRTPTSWFSSCRVNWLHNWHPKDSTATSLYFTENAKVWYNEIIHYEFTNQLSNHESKIFRELQFIYSLKNSSGKTDTNNLIRQKQGLLWSPSGGKIPWPANVYVKCWGGRQDRM